LRYPYDNIEVGYMNVTTVDRDSKGQTTITLADGQDLYKLLDIASGRIDFDRAGEAELVLVVTNIKANIDALTTPTASA
jgi:hypothetical protein